MRLPRSVSCHVLTNRSLRCLQEVSVPRSVDFFGVLTSPSLSRLQEVVCLAQFISFGVLTSRFLCYLQLVSAHLSVHFFGCPEKSLHLPSSGGECASLGRFLSVS